MEFRNAIKKVVAIGAGATMLGATLMGAMAADLKSYPAPFVQNGKYDGLLIVGNAAAASDVIGAIDIAAGLQYSMKQVVTTASTGKTTMENSARIETGSSPLHYGDLLASVKTAVTSSDLPSLLKQGSLTDKEGTVFKYNLQISPGLNTGTSSPSVVFGKSTPETDRPVLYLDFSSTARTINTTIDFPSAPNMTNIMGKTITLFSKEYTISDTNSEIVATAGNEKLTLYSSAIDQTFSAGETSTINVGSSDVTIEVIGVNTQATVATATIKVNGESATVTQGLTTTLGGQKLYVKDIFAYTQPVGGGGVRVFLGSNKLVLEHGQAVTKGSSGTDSVDGTKVVFTASDGKISRIAVETTPYNMYPQKKVLKSGDSILDPVFGGWKMQFAGADEALDASTKSYLKVLPSAEDKIRVEFTAKTGLKYSMDMFKANNTDGGALLISNGDHQIHMENSESIYPNQYFILGNGEYQHVLRLTSIANSSTSLRIQDAAEGGATQTWTYSGTDYTGTMVYDGNSYSFTAAPVTDASASTISLSAGMTNEIYLNNDAKLSIMNTSAEGLSSDSATATNYTTILNLTEKTSYTGGSPHDYGVVFVNATFINSRAGNDLYLPISPWYVSEYSGGSANAAAAMSSFSLIGNSGYDNEGLTPFGTFMKYNSDTSSTTRVEMYAPATQSTFGVFLAPTAAVTTTTGGTQSVTIEKISVGAAKLDTEVLDTYQNYNLIVVGGPCANTVAAKLMGSPANCAANFEVGKATVKLFEHSTGKVAMLVAGASALDTKRAAKAVAGGKLALLPSGAKEAIVTTVTDDGEVKVVSS